MKKSVFLLSVFLLIISHVSRTQTDTLVIDEVLIQSERIPKLFRESARVVSIITSDEIMKSPAGTIDDVLEYALNVDVRQRGGQGVQSDISIRGGSFEQTAILINGVQINDPQTGHHNLNIPVSIEDINRIEILEGPAARMFGANAFSGAINIITGQQDKEFISLRMTGGEYGLLGSQLSGSIKSRKSSHFVSVSHKKSNGYTDNTDFASTNVFYQASADTKAGQFDWQSGYLNKSFGANSFYTPKYPNQFEQIKTGFAHLKFETGERIKVSPEVFYRCHQDRFELFRDEPPAWYSGHNHHLTHVAGAGFNARFDHPAGKTAIGSQWRREFILSNKLGETMAAPKDVPGEDNALFTHSKARNHFSFFIENDMSFSGFMISTGVMSHFSNDFGWHFYPGVDIGYAITDKIRHFASVNQSLRLPTFTDLYYEGPTNVGNPGLKPEKVTTFETGTKFVSSACKTHFSVYHRRGRNIIDWVIDTQSPVVSQKGDTLWESRNITELYTTGFEAMLTLYPQQLINPGFPVSFVSVHYAFNTTNKQSGAFLSRYALDYLRHKLVVKTSHKITNSLNISWQAGWHDREGSFTFFDTEKKQYGTEKEYKPVLLIDGKIWWQNSFLKIFVECSNLLNKKYYDIGNIKLAGRWLSAGVRVKITGKKKNKFNLRW